VPVRHWKGKRKTKSDVTGERGRCPLRKEVDGRSPIDESERPRGGGWELADTTTGGFLRDGGSAPRFGGQQIVSSKRKVNFTFLGTAGMKNPKEGECSCSKPSIGSEKK